MITRILRARQIGEYERNPISPAADYWISPRIAAQSIKGLFSVKPDRDDARDSRRDKTEREREGRRATELSAPLHGEQILHSAHEGFVVSPRQVDLVVNSSGDVVRLWSHLEAGRSARRSAWISARSLPGHRVPRDRDRFPARLQSFKIV